MLTKASGVIKEKFLKTIRWYQSISIDRTYRGRSTGCASLLNHAGLEFARTQSLSIPVPATLFCLAWFQDKAAALRNAYMKLTVVEEAE